jgi:hypothetical protein
MLIDSFAPDPDASEIHRLEIKASGEAVYRALWTTDLGSSAVVKGLLFLRSLPSLVLKPRCGARSRRPFTLQTLIKAGFGQLAEEPGREIVLGITGRFWRPTGNTSPFKREDFTGPVRRGMARAVWNFHVQEVTAGRTLLSTETRINCGDAASRMKFRLYWLFVRPFSGLIRLIMLRAIKRACESAD